MLNINKVFIYLVMLTASIFSSNSFAEGIFEDIGNVEKIDKVAQTVTISGKRMLVQGIVTVQINNRKDHLLNVLEIGTFLSVSGRQDSADNYIITGAHIHRMPATPKGIYQ